MFDPTDILHLVNLAAFLTACFGVRGLIMGRAKHFTLANILN